MTNARGRDLRGGGGLPPGNQAPPRAHILYVEGLSEYAEKTFELARDFNARACGFWVFDRHGQGLSGRFLTDKFKQHSEGFHHDVQDVIRFAETKIPKDGRPIILLGHSTGGTIALMAARERPDLFQGAVVTSPILGFNKPAARLMEPFWARAPLPGWLKERYMFGFHEAWHRRDPRRPHGPEQFSSDKERMDIHDEWPARNPDLRTGGPTIGWVTEACRALLRLRDKDYAGRMSVPVRIFSAGRDTAVDNRTTLTTAALIPGCIHTHITNGKHDLLMDTDDVRDRIINETLKLTGPA